MSRKCLAVHLIVLLMKEGSDHGNHMGEREWSGR